MGYKSKTMPVTSASPTPSRSSLRTKNLQRRLVNRTSDKGSINVTPPRPTLPIAPIPTLLLPHIPITSPAAPALNSSGSSIQRASSPAALSSPGKNDVNCLKGVVACIDIRTDDGADVSANFEQDLKSMGAKTRKTFADTVTHLIYKNGSSLNVKKAMHQKNCKIVNLLWITNCKIHGKHLPEDKYLIDHPENLLLSATKRRKCMEPGEVKALTLGEASDTLENPSSCKRSTSVESLVHPSASKRSKLLANQSPLSPNINIKQKHVALHRKPSAIISKETTSSHYNQSNKEDALPSLADLESDGDTMIENGIPSMEGSMTNKVERSASVPKSRHKTYASNEHASSSGSQRPQVKQEIKAGFYIKNRTASSSKESATLPPSLLRRISSTMAKSSASSKPPICIRRRQRPISNQTTTAVTSSSAATATMNTDTTIPNSPIPTSASPPTPIPTASNNNNTNNATPTIVLTSMIKKRKQKCIEIIEKLGKYRLASTVDETTTHVIVDCQRRTESVVLGLLHGVWLVTPDWLLNSDKSCNYLDETDYEATQFFPRARAARQREPLLPSTTNIYIHAPSVPKDLVQQLVIKCGGKLVTQLEDADIVISNTPLDCAATTVTDDWLLNCVEQWRYLSTSIYAPSSN